jgi:hypothetical protein
MPFDPPNSHTMIEHIERALVLLACFTEQDGDVHLPMCERFEAEPKELKGKEGVKARVRRREMAYSDIGLQVVGFHPPAADGISRLVGWDSFGRHACTGRSGRGYSRSCAQAQRDSEEALARLSAQSSRPQIPERVAERNQEECGSTYRPL